MIKWEEIYNSCEEPGAVNYQATYRAKVQDGWLVRHETSCNYQYPTEENEWDEEGYQDVTNTIIFMPDNKHLWEILEEKEAN